MRKAIYIGVDGGATKTEVVAVDPEGGHLYFSVSGASNPASVGVEKSCLNIVDGVLGSIKPLKGGRGGVEIDLLALSIAGYLDGLWDRELDKCIRRRLGLEINNIAIFEDIKSAHSSAFIDGNGIVGIIGTGSNFYGRFMGVEVYVGGWGHLIDDVGSAYSVGAKGLRYLSRYIDGRESSYTCLAECYKHHYGVSSFRELVRKIYDSDDPKGYIASFSKCVFKCASSGDSIAYGIVREESMEIALALYTVRRQLASRAGRGESIEVDVSLTGTVYKSNKHLLKKLIEEFLKERFGWVTDIKDPIIRQSCASLVYVFNIAGAETLSADRRKVLDVLISKCRV